MSNGKCLKCNGERDRHGCPRCDDPVQRLETMRQSQKQFWRDVRSGKVTLKRPPKAKPGGYFMQQCRQAAEIKGKRLEAMGERNEMPLSGQDAALPVGDR